MSIDSNKALHYQCYTCCDGPQALGKTRALLIGINYFDQRLEFANGVVEELELGGSHEDVRRMKEFIGAQVRNLKFVSFQYFIFPILLN